MNNPEFPFTLKDSLSQRTVTGKITQIGGELEIYFDGYGNCSCDPKLGSSVLIEVFDKSLRAIVWGDINQEDPTSIIELEGARETLRADTNNWH
ncbi:MAG: hypothetical protein ACRDEA_22480 [Microcystaceae cyanobacterium]